MGQQFKSLPPLPSLRTFEAAARHKSFKQAADELCVTQAAISRQVRLLEARLGVSLFTRGHRKVDLTEAGETLFETVNKAFIDITAASRDIQTNLQANHLNLYATSSFARLWLVPRLARLKQAHPQIHLNLMSLEENPDMLNRFDAGITLGLESSTHYQSDFLFAEEIFPVCTPGFLAENPKAYDIEGLLQLPLLELDASFWRAKWWSAIDWSSWQSQLGQDKLQVNIDMTFSHFPMLLDAVLEGVGVGLAWRHLVQDRLDDGRLVQPIAQTLKAPNRGHYFVCRKDLANLPEMQLLRRWLLEQTADFRH